jgi:GTP-binding protein
MPSFLQFVDEVMIEVTAGSGGPGCVSFRREAFAPQGGPDGGDGGRGGDILLEASLQMANLRDMRYKRKYRAKNGLHGSGARKSGKAGEPTKISVPVGTILKDHETGEVLFDFTAPGQWQGWQREHTFCKLDLSGS